MHTFRQSQTCKLPTIIHRAAYVALISGIALLFAFIVGPAAQAQTFRVIHAFTGQDGYDPEAGLTLDTQGNLYGTTIAGLASGTVFQLTRVNSSWTLTTLYGFGVDPHDAATPLARAVFGPGGTLYGTTINGGAGHNCPSECGAVYNLRPPATICETAFCPWTETVIYSFPGGVNGYSPYSVDPVFDQAGNLYGTTEFGGSSGDGVVFKLTLSGGAWTETVIHDFTGNDGYEPASGVIFDNAGNLYGTTQYGGSHGGGTVFRLARSGSGWVASTLYSFHGTSDGGLPLGALILDRAGNLYGTTPSGGSRAGGTVFELSPSGESWTFTVLYALSGNFGCGPQGNLAMDAAGNLYGTTACGGANVNGSVFKLTSMNGVWTYTSLHDFTGGSDGGEPLAGVTLDASGNVFGTAAHGGNGGSCDGICGVVFEITP